jgi:ABC-type molybdate transport system substrate-binding protein
VAKPGAAAFVEYVRSSAAAAVFEKHGFLVLQ